MSNRANAARYSQMVGNQGSSGFADLDLFGLRRKRRLQESEERLSEYRGMTDIDEQFNSRAEERAQKQKIELEQLRQKHLLEEKEAAFNYEIAKAMEEASEKGFQERLTERQKAELSRETARQGAIDTRLMGSGILPQTLPGYSDAVQAAIAQGSTSGANIFKSRAGIGEKYYGSKQGESDVTTGLRGVELAPAFETAARGNTLVPAGGFGLKFDPMNLSVKPQPIYGSSASVNEFEPKMIVGPDGNPTTQMFPTRTTSMQPGRVGITVSPEDLNKILLTPSEPSPSPSPSDAAFWIERLKKAKLLGY